jgi:ribokinase
MAEKVPKAVVIGGTYVDMAVRCGRIPSSGSSVAGSELAYTAAGPGPTQSAAAALCGCSVHLVSMVGGDPFGPMVRSSLAELGVDTEFVHTAEAKNTGIVVTLVNSAGENASCVYRGANTALRPRDIESAEKVIAAADICLVHGRLPQDAIVAAIRCAKLHGVRLVLNPARPLAASGLQAETPAVEYFNADVLVPNLYEAADITDTSDAGIHTAKLIGSDLVARGAGAAVITIGKRGCMVVDRSGADHIPAFEVELVDQTGRGDAFAGALAAYCAVSDSLREAARFASAAAALACTKFGSIESMPTRAEIIELLQRSE